MNDKNAPTREASVMNTKNYEHSLFIIHQNQFPKNFIDEWYFLLKRVLDTYTKSDQARQEPSTVVVKTSKSQKK